MMDKTFIPKCKANKYVLGYVTHSFINYPSVAASGHLIRIYVCMSATCRKIYKTHLLIYIQGIVCNSSYLKYA